MNPYAIIERLTSQHYVQCICYQLLAQVIEPSVLAVSVTHSSKKGYRR